MTETRTLTLFSEMTVDDHRYFIREAIRDSGLMDFLSDRAQDNVRTHVGQHFVGLGDAVDGDTWSAHASCYLALEDHPLGEILTKNWKRKVSRVVAEKYNDLREEHGG